MKHMAIVAQLVAVAAEAEWRRAPAVRTREAPALWRRRFRPTAGADVLAVTPLSLVTHVGRTLAAENEGGPGGSRGGDHTGAPSRARSATAAGQLQ